MGHLDGILSLFFVVEFSVEQAECRLVAAQVLHLQILVEVLDVREDALTSIVFSSVKGLVDE